MPIETTITQQKTVSVDSKSEQSQRNYFSVTIESQLVRAFRLLFDYFPFLFKDQNLALSLFTEEHGEPPEEVLSVIDVFRSLISDLEECGIEIPYKNLCYRYVAAEDSLTVETIVASTWENGGKDPKSKKTWIHVAGSPTQLKDYMHRSLGKPGVIMIYDRTKLTPITEEDMRAFPFHAYYYGMKPKEGLTLNDALLGMITILS